MKKLLIVVVVLAFLLTACNRNTRDDDVASSDATGSAAETAPLEILSTEADPFLLDGESIYGNWTYAFIDVDNNNIAERISFTNVVKGSSETNIITRLAIEFDFASNDSHTTPVYIERSHTTLMHPELQCANTPDGTLIFIKDPYAAYGEELYPFIYTNDGILSELKFDGLSQYPNNAISASHSLNFSHFAIEKATDSELRVSTGGSTYYRFTPALGESATLCASYKFTPELKDVILAFEPSSLTIVYGLRGTLSSNSDDIQQSLPIRVLITMQYSSGTFIITDISFTSQ